jgi:biopolymer transport protein TolR
MVISSGGSGNTWRKNRFSRSLNSEINVTPFVDVMLVLLIIFMVTAPLMTVGVPVDLPKTQAAPLSEKTEPLTITVTAQGKIYLMETEVSLETLVPKLQAIVASKPDTRIYVRGDQAIHFGLVMEVMGHLSAAGFNKVGLLAELPKSDLSKKP